MYGEADETQISSVTCIGIAPHLPKNTIPIHRTGYTLRLGSLLSGMRLPLGVTLATWIYACCFQCNAEVLQQDSTKSSSKGSHIFKESIPKLSSRVDIVKRNGPGLVGSGPLMRIPGEIDGSVHGRLPDIPLCGLGPAADYWANYIPLRAPEQGRVWRFWPHECTGPARPLLGALGP